MAVAVLAMSLVSCDGTKNQGENKTGSQPVVEQTTSDDDSTEKQVAAVPSGLSGDMEKDAEMIVKATMEQSMKMAEGTAEVAETHGGSQELLRPAGQERRVCPTGGQEDGRWHYRCGRKAKESLMTSTR